LRTLEQIQADIRFLLREKESFFLSLFNSNTSRIQELRLEEKKAIDTWLYQNDHIYRNLSQENIALLSDIHWELKIINHNRGMRHMHTGEISASIELKGYLHGRGLSYYLFPADISTTVSNFNALGELQLFNIQKFTEPSHVPKTFKCFTDKEGSVHIERLEQEYSLLEPRVVIGDVVGDPFNGNSSARKIFLRNRQLMLEIVGKQIVFT